MHASLTRRLFACAGFLVSVLPVVAHTQGFTVVSVGDTLSWSSFDPSTGQSTQMGSLGAAGDHLAPGHWTSPDGKQLAVTSLDSAGNIVWKVAGPDGAVTEKVFGKSGQYAVSATDLDKSGIADPVVVGPEGRKLTWQAALDLFRDGTTTTTFTHGLKGEIPFFINLDGTGEQLATLVAGKASTTVRLLDPRTGAKKLIRRLPRVPAGTSRPVPVPITAPDGKQLLLVSRENGSSTILAVFDLTARTMFMETVGVTGDVVVGDYTASPGHEVAVGRALTVTVVNLFDGAELAVSAPDGVLVDGFNVNFMSNQSEPNPNPRPTPTPDPTPTAGPTPTPGAGTPPNSEGLKRVCASVSAIAPGEMLIKSDPSGHIHGGDPRTTGYTVVCSRLCPAKLGYAQFFYSDGTFAGAVAKYGIFSGNGKPRLYGAVGQAPQHFSKQIAQKAATIGNGKLYLQMSAATEGEATSCKEFSTSGRNGSL